MTFVKGHTFGKRFIKGTKPIPHKENCKCFRCTKIPYNLNKKMSTEFKAKISNSLVGNKRRWLGDKAKIKAIHMYIYKKYGLATKCDKCHTKTAKKYEWSNISRTYQRDMSDWWQLCQSCHRKYDHPKNRR